MPAIWTSTSKGWLSTLLVAIVLPVISVAEEPVEQTLLKISSLEASAPGLSILCLEFLEKVPDHDSVWARLNEAEREKLHTGFAQEVTRLYRRSSGLEVSPPTAKARPPGKLAPVGSLEMAHQHLERRPTEAVAWFDLADAYRESGNPVVGRLIAMHGGLDRHADPSHERIWSYLDLYQRVFGTRRLGREIVRLLPAGQLQSKDALYRASEQLIELNRPVLAQPYVAALGRTEEASGDYWMLSGNMWLAMGDHAQAERSFSQALLKFGDPEEAWRALARIAARRGDLEQTLVWLKKLRVQMDDDRFVNFLMDPAFEKLPQVLQHLD